MNNAGNLINASFAFSGCKSLENIELSGEMISLELAENMFEGCYELTSMNIGFLKGSTKLKNLFGIFKSCFNLLEINFPSISAYYLRDFSYMFYECSNLKSANLKGIDAERITNMDRMFYNCKNLTNINIYYLDTRNILSFDYIFEGVKNVTVEYNPDITDIALQREIKKIIIE